MNVDWFRISVSRYLIARNIAGKFFSPCFAFFNVYFSLLHPWFKFIINSF